MDYVVLVSQQHARFVGGDMCGVGEHEVHPAGERDTCEDSWDHHRLHSPLP